MNLKSTTIRLEFEGSHVDLEDKDYLYINSNLILFQIP